MDVEFFRLPKDIAPAGKVGDQYPLRIAHEFRLDMLVGFRPPSYSAHMNAAFMGKSAVADKGLPFEMPHIRYLVDKPRYVPQFIQPAISKAGISQFYLQVGNDRAKIGIPATFAETIDGPLHLHSPVCDRNQRVCHSA